MEYSVVESSTYEDLENSANIIINDVCDYYDLTKLTISVEDIYNYFISNYPIEMIGFTSCGKTYKSKLLSDNSYVNLLCVESVDPIFTKNVDGFTVKRKDKYVIELNCDLPISRFTYTLLHELAHVRFHLFNVNDRLFKLNSQVNANALDSKLEIEANYIASLLFIPDEQMKEYFCHDYSYQQILNETGMSNKALFNRLKNFLRYSIQVNPVLIISWIENYRNGDIFLPKFLKKNYYQKALF